MIMGVQSLHINSINACIEDFPQFTQLDIPSCASKSSIRCNRFWCALLSQNPLQNVHLLFVQQIITFWNGCQSISTTLILLLIIISIGGDDATLSRKNRKFQSKTIKWFQELKSTDSLIDLRWQVKHASQHLSHGLWTKTNFYLDSVDRPMKWLEFMQKQSDISIEMRWFRNQIGVFYLNCVCVTSNYRN